jgi:hypothetical protein
MSWHYLGEKTPKVGEMVRVFNETTETVVEAEYDDNSFFDNNGFQLDAYYWKHKS